MLAACMLSHVFCVLGLCLIHKQTEALVSCLYDKYIERMERRTISNTTLAVS